MCMNNLSRAVTWQWTNRESNQRPRSHATSTLPRHIHHANVMQKRQRRQPTISTKSGHQVSYAHNDEQANKQKHYVLLCLKIKTKPTV